MGAARSGSGIAWRGAAWSGLLLLALGVAGFVVYVYAMLPLGVMLNPEMRANFELHALAIYTHIFASVAALVLGPFQFLPGLRRTWPALHRWSGRLYLGIGVLVGGLAALYVAQYAYGGPLARIGFSMLALAWLYTGTRALAAIMKRNVDAHRRWMVLNFALTCAAITLRIYIPLSIFAGIEFSAAYPVIAWLCWLPNLMIAVIVMRRRSPSSMQAFAPAAASDVAASRTTS